MKTPHKHAELIKAWADGAEIEYRDRHNDWVSLPRCGDWDAHPDFEYRIKPEPKPDVVLIRRVDIQCLPSDCFPNGYVTVGAWPNANLKLTFDGETGQLKSAEVL